MDHHHLSLPPPRVNGFTLLANPKLWERPYSTLAGGCPPRSTLSWWHTPWGPVILGAFIQAKGKLSLATEHQLFLGQTDMSTPQLAEVTNRDPQAAVRALQALTLCLASAFLSLQQTLQRLGEGARQSDPAASLCAALSATEIGGNEVFSAPAAPTTHLVGELSRQFAQMAAQQEQLTRSVAAMAAQGAPVDIWCFSHIYVFVTLLMPYCDASCIT